MNPLATTAQSLFLFDADADPAELAEEDWFFQQVLLRPEQSDEEEEEAPPDPIWQSILKEEEEPSEQQQSLLCRDCQTIKPRRPGGYCQRCFTRRETEGTLPAATRYLVSRTCPGFVDPASGLRVACGKQKLITHRQLLCGNCKQCKWSRKSKLKKRTLAE